MPQYLIHPKHPLRTLVYIVLALGLVVGGYLTFKASQMSTEGRSKAALTYKTYINWEFEGTDTEGWTAKALKNITVSKSLLKAKVALTKAFNPLLEYKKLIDLSKGNKYFIIRINISPPHGIESITPIPEKQTYSILLDYIVQGEKKIKPLLLNGTANNQWEDLYVKLPFIEKVSIENITLGFTGLKTDSTITIDWIRFIDQIPPSPTKLPPPPITPKPTGLVVPTATPTPSSMVKTKSSLPGDCNGDGSVNAGDISAMVLELKDMQDTGNTNPLDVGKGKFKGALGCDVNYDRVFNVADQTALSLLISSNTKSSLPGDCNGDGSVNAGDISAMVLELKDMQDTGNTNPFEVGKGDFKGARGCDVNYDSKFNIADQTALSLLISSNTKSSLPGDCNGDSVINDTDRGTLTKEVFDGTNPLEAGKGSIKGSLGCDANYDRSINAGDISAQTFLEL